MFHVSQHLDPIPWDVEKENAIYSEESFGLLWEMELGVSMTTYSGNQNKVIGKTNCSSNKLDNNFPTYYQYTSKQNYSRYHAHQYEYQYVDFSSAVGSFNKARPDCIDFDEIVGERLEAIMLYGGAKSKDDVVLLRDVAHHKSLVEATDHKQLTFVNKLMKLLTDNPDPTVITWLPHGRSFIVRDKDRFVSDILPMYFASTLYKSFQRQLNMWGFQRISGSIDKGAYYHQLFLRGIPRLSNLMERKDSMSFKTFNKGNVRKRKGRPFSNPELEPDFYKLSRLRPLP